MFRFTDWYRYVEDMTTEAVVVPVHINDAKVLELIFSDLMAPIVFEVGIKTTRKILRDELGLGEVLDSLDSAIRAVGGRAFIRWNNVYPKDVCPFMDSTPGLVKLPGKMGNVCLFEAADVFLYVSLNSMRVVSVTLREPGSLLPIIVRRPVEFRDEVRVFIERGKPVAAVHYYYGEKLAASDVKSYMLDAVRYAMEVWERIPHHSATIDVGVVDGRLTLVEINPPLSSGRTDPIYEPLSEKWKDLEGVLLAWREDEWKTVQVPVIEVV